MTHAVALATAKTFVERFCAGQVERIEELLADDFRLKGPLGAWSKQEYLAVLSRDRPRAGTARILSAVADGDDVALLYEHRHEGGSQVVGQTFRVAGGRIAKSLVVFDSGAPA